MCYAHSFLQSEVGAPRHILGHLVTLSFRHFASSIFPVPIVILATTPLHRRLNKFAADEDRMSHGSRALSSLTTRQIGADYD